MTARVVGASGDGLVQRVVAPLANATLAAGFCLSLFLFLATGGVASPLSLILGRDVEPCGEAKRDR